MLKHFVSVAYLHKIIVEKGLVAAGSALSTYGNSFEQVVGLVTSGTEIMTGKSAQVARGLKKC